MSDVKRIRIKGHRVRRSGGHDGALSVAFLPGPNPYLRIGDPGAIGNDEYVCSVDGRASIRRLRDYLTNALRKRRPTR